MPRLVYSGATKHLNNFTEMKLNLNGPSNHPCADAMLIFFFLRNHRGTSVTTFLPFEGIQICGFLGGREVGVGVGGLGIPELYCIPRNLHPRRL